MDDEYEFENLIETKLEFKKNDYIDRFLSDMPEVSGATGVVSLKTYKKHHINLSRRKKGREVLDDEEM
ncbi:MAG: hypothetical protein IMZ52_05775 [Actinobacteria bacterium]|nr:hypothetical protein [Actinomycetota bacterium]